MSPGTQGFRADHVVLNLLTGTFECGHCGTASQVVLPLLISGMRKITTPFLKAHRGCQPAAELARLRAAAPEVAP